MTFRKYEILFVGALILLSAAISSYRLSESPPVWFDEGIFTQVAENLTRYRAPLIRLAPENFIHAGSMAQDIPASPERIRVSL